MTVAISKPLKLNWPTILFLGGIHAIALLGLLPSNFNLQAVAVALFLHWFTGCLGITLGWHRLISHRSFSTPKWLEYFFVFCGSLSCQASPIEWIGLHRHHHAHSDQALDHHNSNLGFWWSHMGWMCYDIPAKQGLERYTRDIAQDPVYRFFDRYFLPLQGLLALLLFAWGGWSFVVWGVFVRLVAVYHCTWFVNSATHRFGYRSHDSGDKSRNCWWVALLTYGEGWHNNHHAFQYSARHGLRWWEFDVTWLTIALLGRLGLAKNIKLPNR